MFFLKNFAARLSFVVVLTFSILASTQSTFARTSGDPMAVFDGRISELLSELTIVGNASSNARQTIEYRALVIRIAQMQAFRPNLEGLPLDQQWDCISYWVETWSKGKKDRYDNDNDDDDDDENS